LNEIDKKYKLSSQNETVTKTRLFQTQNILANNLRESQKITQQIQAQTRLNDQLQHDFKNIQNEKDNKIKQQDIEIQKQNALIATTAIEFQRIDEQQQQFRLEASRWQELLNSLKNDATQLIRNSNNPLITENTQLKSQDIVGKIDEIQNRIQTLSFQSQSQVSVNFIQISRVITNLQVCLNNQGLLKSSITGRYDDSTKKALKQFLKDSALPDELITQPERVLPLCENKLSLDDAGNISLSSGSLSILNGAQLNTSTYGNGDGGNINITTGNLILSRNNLSLSETDTSVYGVGGDIALDATKLIIDGITSNSNNLFHSRDHFVITGRGSLPPNPLDIMIIGTNSNGGNITINAQETISLDGTDIFSRISESSGHISLNSKSDITTGIINFDAPAPVKVSDFLSLWRRRDTRRSTSNNSTAVNIEITDKHLRYTVIVPIIDSNTLTEVRKFVPTAFAAKSSSGDYVNAGTYHERSLADSLAQLLRTRGINAKVKTF
jgi:hypothetical protein